MTFRTEVSPDPVKEPYWCWQRITGAGAFLAGVLMLILYKLLHL